MQDAASTTAKRGFMRLIIVGDIKCIYNIPIILKTR